MDKRVQDAIKTVTEWMHSQMYEQRTEWTYGNEHDRMHEAYSFLAGLTGDDRED